ncbi:endocuticle structural glycoprotein SgAbd-9 [Drosophila innubila]|uniref:endocuticle structural glycoprotein SgAbd-9 n=1 Tax=Drosophila innubila TaxID=198719 RepID=UPI00148DB8C1|nr:endocuticle structural glycoprotein SgAbd-9 [Drosophila innubila]
MFKLFLSLFVLCLAGALAAPADKYPTAPPVAILESGNEKSQDGSYHFFYQNEDGTHREETAVVHNPGTDDAYLAITGSYTYIDLDGKENVVNYKADNHGFVPEGNSILPQISLSAKQASELQPVPDTDYKQPPRF